MWSPLQHRKKNPDWKVGNHFVPLRNSDFALTSPYLTNSNTVKTYLLFLSDNDIWLFFTAKDQDEI